MSNVNAPLKRADVSISLCQFPTLISALWGQIETIRQLDYSDEDKINLICDVCDISHHLMIETLNEIIEEKGGGKK
jgi:hypothetical protein